MMIGAAFLALALDGLLGDPRTRLHPVVLIGNFIAWLEKRLRRGEQGPRRQIVWGGVLVVCVLAVVYGAARCLIEVGGAWGPKGLLAVNAVLLYFTISPRALAEAGLEIRRYLVDGDLKNARFKVGWIVGRDTERLSVPEVTRATVETIAENTVDGVISPLFYFFIGGAPLAFLYRAVNTLDSMIAYKNERYLYFGRVAAYTDDVLNYIPARLTGVCFVAAAFLLRLDGKNAWRMMRRDAAAHPSPNGGYSEATVAGALGVQLGGRNEYFGAPHFRALMGDARRPLAPRHIMRVVQLMYAATLLFLSGAGLTAYFIGRFYS